MENTVRISCSAVTHIGTDQVVNENRIYANGKFLQTHQIDNSQISLESSGSLFIFALSDGMDTEIDTGSRISIVEDLKKFHKKAATSSKDIQIKLDEMTDYVQQSNNLLYSMLLGEVKETSRSASFAGLLIDGGKIAAVNLGNCRIYKLDVDNLKPMINDYRRTERLLKMGIINNEQAEMLSGQQKNSSLNSSLQVKKSEVFPLKEGSVFLLCSNGLTGAVSEDAIFEILADNREIDVAAGLLVKEAIENGSEDNVSAMVIRIEKAQEIAIPEDSIKNISGRRIQASPARYSRVVRKRSLDLAKLVSTFIMVAIIAAIIFGSFTVWQNLRKPNKDKQTLSQNTTQTQETGNSTADDTLPEDSTYAEETQSSTIADAVTPDDNGQAVDEADTVIGDNTTYEVKAGDNLMKISKQFYGEEGKYILLIQANDLTDPDKIQIGQVLKIPPAD